MNHLVLRVAALFGLSLALFGAGCSSPSLEGAWVSEQPVDGSVIELTFTDTRLIGSGNRADAEDPAKTSEFKVTADYSVVNKVQNIHQIVLKNPDVAITGTLANQEQQSVWETQGEAYLSQYSVFAFTLAEDGSRLTLNSSRTGEIEFRKK